MLHFDFLFLGGSKRKKRYAIGLKDDLSGYCWLEACAAADAETAAAVLEKYIRIFSAPRFGASDQGSHFKNEVLRDIYKYYRIQNNVTVAYSP